MKGRSIWVGLAAASLTLAVAHAQDADRGVAPESARPEIVRRLDALVVTRSDRGKVFCGLWRGPAGYPTDRRRAVGEAIDRTIVGHRAHCVFSGERLAPGAEYAVAAFHDENGNDDLDRGLFGIPTEGTGASNDARGFMGPPPYDGARFLLPPAPLCRITIHIGY
jgi:uncharacterized protein (DUF2141 family)